MQRKINILSMSYLVFLLLLFTSGALSGVLGEAVYFLAFLVPFLICMACIRGEEKSSTRLFGLKRESILYTLVISAPAVCTIMLVSMITSALIFSTTGKTNDIDVGNSLLVAMFSHALLPAILEEALFRYLPMRVLSECSKKTVILLSSFFFALIHHSLFSIPYAFLAGIILMSVNLAFDSVWPSVIIHFLNNAVSVLLMFGLGYIVLPCLLGLLLISLVIIFLKRSEYKNLFIPLLSGGERVTITVELVVFTAVNLLIAVLALF